MQSACDDAAVIQRKLAMLAAQQLRCCFSASNLVGLASDDIKCWCYYRGDDGEPLSVPCTNRKLIINENGVGTTRYSYQEYPYTESES